MRVFAIAGLSGTGKTTVIVQLVRELIARGYSVATLKSTAEDVAPPAHKDTGAHWMAGANPVVLLGPRSTTITHATRKKLSEVFTGDEADFLIVEGGKRSESPKVWCVVGEDSAHDETPTDTLALVVWNNSGNYTSLDIPVIMSDEIDRLVRLVELHAADIGSVEL